MHDLFAECYDKMLESIESLKSAKMESIRNDTEDDFIKVVGKERTARLMKGFDKFLDAKKKKTKNKTKNKQGINF